MPSTRAEEDVNRPGFVLDLSSATTQSGYYVLSVDLGGILDGEGFEGEEVWTMSWTQLADGKVSVSAYATPKEGGKVSPEGERVDYGSRVKFEAQAADGFDFLKWMRDGEMQSDKSSFEMTVTEDVLMQAQFVAKRYDVEILFNEAEGSVVGGGSGIYNHGDKLSVSAVAMPGYLFSHWENGFGETVSTNASLEVEVTDDMTLTAVFKVDDSGVDGVQTQAVMVYPVPARTKLYIDGDFDSIESVVFTDIKGSNVKICRGYHRGTPINVSALAAGVYIVRVHTDRGVTTHRIIKL